MVTKVIWSWIPFSMGHSFHINCMEIVEHSLGDAELMNTKVLPNKAFFIYVDFINIDMYIYLSSTYLPSIYLIYLICHLSSIYHLSLRLCM